ncbi:MAG: hypothetical protein DRN30_02180 [Thermoplasmata archaeon]|nr:MAG: hypothetical protein DRN30_02180 [Thermoplasmata archaeon]
MSFHKHIASLLGGKLIAFNVKLSKALGDDIPGALFLGQLLYWWDKGNHQDKIWKTDNDFYEECGLTPKQCKRIRKKLIELGLIEVKKEGIPAKNYYYLKIEAISNLVCNGLTREDKRDSLVNTEGTDRTSPKGLTITKHTQKNTTKNNNIMSEPIKSGSDKSYEERVNDFFNRVKDEPFYKDWLEAFPDVCNDRELFKAKAWLLANKRKAKKDFKRFLYNWLSKAQDKFDRIRIAGRISGGAKEKIGGISREEIIEFRNKMKEIARKKRMEQEGGEYVAG